MPSSPVEKYEKILAADPTSLVFVELAKALVDAGDLARSAAVCRGGVERHPKSIVGWVLWGKALLLAGQPADAMERFERATGIEPENPYAYNLIGELLVQRKLFRSALPILRKAVALQPTDARVRQWLDQAQAAAQDGLVPLEEQAFSEDRTTAWVPAWDPPEANEGAERRTAAPAAPPRGPSLAPPIGPSRPAPPGRAAPPPIPEPTAPPPIRSSATARMRALDLLGDLPDAPPEPIPAASIPSVSADEAQQIAERYESELREEYSIKRDVPLPWLRRHWLAVSLAAAAFGAGSVAATGAILYRRHYRQVHLRDFLDRARAGLLEDTEPSITGASHQLAEVLAAEPKNPEARALSAQAAATLYREYAGSSALRDQAAELLRAGDLEKSAPDPVWTARYLLAQDPRSLRAALLALPLATAGPWVNYVAGRLLLAGGDAGGALARFDAALKAAPAHVPTLLAVGDYYLGAADPGRAAELFSLAHAASPLSVGGVVGLVEAQLALGEAGPADEKALAAAEAGQVDAKGPAAVDRELSPVPLALRERLDLATARLFAVDGKFDAAIARLQDGLGQHADEIAAYAGGLADVLVLAGRYADAEVQARRVVEKRPKDPAALARLGRILFGRQRYKELLARIPALGADPRPLHVLRARAYQLLGACPPARREIEATRRGDKIAVGAAVVSALCDAVDGNQDQARQTLRQIAALAHPPAAAFLALGALDAEAHETAKATARDRAAIAADPSGYEPHCALGRLLVSSGHASAGREELVKALELNRDHPEAHVSLGLSELEAGQGTPARFEIEAAVHEAPWSPDAQLALARLELGDHHFAEALRSAARATELAPRDPKIRRWRGRIAQQAGQRKLATHELQLAKKLEKAKQKRRGR